ncbi:TIGR03915 family putative DNA repair protein [bacterium SCSIO 12696]|nr:TIGR03915 family putative DNA repair protein [bacterium SCSIO 12696]
MWVLKTNNFDAWRDQARLLLKAGVEPNQVCWNSELQPSLLYENSASLEQLAVKHSELRIPKQFFSLAKSASHYRCHTRWALLYRIAWRLVFDDRRLLTNPVDDDIRCLHKMCKTVGREIHKMHAFVRFQKVPDASLESGERFVAWFEPGHPVLPAGIHFFVKRFHNMHWSLLTPDHCAHWNLEQLTIGDGVHQKPNTTDELEDLWLTYYKSIFNPARLKSKAMQSEMPKKYWRNLPEAALIPELEQSARQRTARMIDQGYSDDWQKTAKSRYVQKAQEKLRRR